VLISFPGIPFSTAPKFFQYYGTIDQSMNRASHKTRGTFRLAVNSDNKEAQERRAIGQSPEKRDIGEEFFLPLLRLQRRMELEFQTLAEIQKRFFGFIVIPLCAHAVFTGRLRSLCGTFRVHGALWFKVGFFESKLTALRFLNRRKAAQA